MIKCTRCECYKNDYGINCVPFSGNSKTDFYFLGEMAGNEEAKKSITEPAHFINDAGVILDKLLELGDIKREEIAIANSLRCYKANNTKPNKNELDACFIFTLREINEINPKVVVALGGTAMYQTLGIVDSVTNYRGKLLWSDKIKRNVLVTYHPMAVGYDPSKKDDIESDFLKLKSLINKEPDKIKNYEYVLIDTIEKFDYYFSYLKYKDLYIDMEMTGLDPYQEDSHIRTFQIGTADHICVILPEVLYKRKDKIRYLMQTNPVIGQDFTIDAKWLYVKLDSFPENWKFDTCIAEYIISGMGNNDLNSLVGKYNRDYYGYWKEVEATGGAHKIADGEILYQYGANDSGSLISIHTKQLKQLYKLNRNYLYENITLPCNKLLTKMSLRGIMIDKETLLKTDKKYEIKGERALRKIITLPGISECEHHFKKNFNPRSSDMIKWLLLDYYKLPILKKTKKENPSIGQKEMEIYAEKYNNPYCKIMEKYRSIQTIRENFLSGILPKLNDGIAHTVYSLHATTTGRPNSRDPNLLNTPREKDIKKCYVARDGHSFVCGDESQLEVRIGSVVYNEPRLIEICNDLSKDIHSNITAKAFKKTYEEVYNGYKSDEVYWVELRVKGKSVQFGVIYQQGSSTLGYQLGIKESEAQSFINEYYENFPDLKINIDRTKELIIKQGYLDNYFGFRRTWRYHTAEDKATLREGINFLVQSLAWNLIQLCMIQIDNKLKERKLKGRLILQVYDSIIVEAPDKEIYEVADIMKNVMTNVNKPYENINRVVLATDIEVGKNLAEMRKII